MAKSQFGALIKGLRLKQGLTQAQLAERLGVSPPHISQIELGRRLPTDRLCIRLATALDYDRYKLVQQVRDKRDPEMKLLYGDKDDLVDVEEEIKDLERQISFLKQVLPSENYGRLVATVQGVLDGYGSGIAQEDRLQGDKQPA